MSLAAISKWFGWPIGIASVVMTWAQQGRHSAVVLIELGLAFGCGGLLLLLLVRLIARWWVKRKPASP